MKLDYFIAKDGMIHLCHLLEEEAKSIRKDLYHKMERLVHKAEENQFNLVVLGQFKRGKTTFINAMLGQDILPTSVTPLTSVITKIAYGQKIQLEVVFLNQERKMIPLDQLSQYVTERENPKNEKGVQEVFIYYPAEFLKGGIFMIDTPGVGSVYQHNTDVAHEIIPEVDAALFLLGVDPPISEVEYHFLHDVKSYAPKIFFLQNKIDLMQEKEQVESLEFSAKVIREALESDEVFIYPISARKALEGRIQENDALVEASKLPVFENDLMSFLIENKGRVMLQKVLKQSLNVASELLLDLQLREKATQLPVQVLQEKNTAFERSMVSIDQDKKDNIYLLQGETASLIDVVQEDLNQLKNQLIETLKEERKRFLKTKKELRGKGLEDALWAMIQDKVYAAFESWQKGEEDKIEGLLLKIMHRFEKKTNEVVETIVRISTELFDLKIDYFSAIETAMPSKGLYYIARREKSFWLISFKSFYRWIPDHFHRQFLMRESQRKIEDWVDNNCGRVRYDFVMRLKETLGAFSGQLEEKIQETQNHIHQVIQEIALKKQKDQQEISVMEDEINAHVKAIECIKKELESWQQRFDRE